MKKQCSNSKLNPTNFVRSASSHSKTPLGSNEKLMETPQKSPVNIENELSLLKRQIGHLQCTVDSMQRESELKDKAFVSLMQEKEQLNSDLKKQRRSNNNLKQQLEDERDFYYKEKEQYCNEMNSYKKHRQKEVKRDEVEGGFNKEMASLRYQLNQTLEANYNLSVKFLRMKNTKLSLKNQLRKVIETHEFVMEDHKCKLEELQKELDEVISDHFIKPIPPSSKKYLQMIKQNGGLIHENLCLQQEVDRLNLELERLKMNDMRRDTNKKLKYINNMHKAPDKSAKCTGGGDAEAAGGGHRKKKPCESDTATSSTTDAKTESKKSSVHSIKTIFEKEQHSDVPSITILKEAPKEDSPQNYELMTVSRSNVSSSPKESEMTFYASMKSYDAYRTQSAPEIVQTVQTFF